MRVLIACEFSGVVREAFRKRGHDAWSCDLLPADDGSRFHFECDVLSVLRLDWDLMVAHPPCTFLTMSGNRWFKPEYRERFPNRPQQREDAIAFFLAFMDAPIGKVCVENPVGVMSSRYRKPDQYIQPHHFGHPETKKTGLWLRGLPLLEPTKVVEPEYYKNPDGSDYRDRGGSRYSKTHYLSGRLPVEERSKFRSITCQGVADAMAEQWENNF